MIFIRNWTVALSVVLLAGLLLSGCLGVKTPPVSLNEPPTVLVDYHRTGGFAGLNDRLVIFDNGAVILSAKTKNREFSLNQSDIHRINEIFEQAQFTSMAGNYTSRRADGADFIQYSIRYHGKIVKTEDSAIPPTLQPIIDEMNRIIAQSERPGIMPAISRIPA